MSKKSATYLVLRNEPRMGIGGWTHDLVQGETLSGLPEDVVEALLAAELIEEVDAPPASEEADG